MTLVLWLFFTLFSKYRQCSLEILISLFKPEGELEMKNTGKIHDLMLARISPLIINLLVFFLVINLLVLGFLSLRYLNYPLTVHCRGWHGEISQWITVDEHWTGIYWGTMDIALFLNFFLSHTEASFYSHAFRQCCGSGTFVADSDPKQNGMTKVLTTQYKIGYLIFFL